MIRYLSTDKKYTIIFGYLSALLFSVYYIYNTNITVKEHIKYAEISNIIMHYNLYYKIYSVSPELKNMLIENTEYIDTDDFVDEYSLSTPFYIDKKDKQINKYDLTFKFFDKYTKHDSVIANKILKLEKLKNKEYIYKFKEKSISLFGTVPNKGYILIDKQLTYNNYIKEMLDDFFIKIVIVGIINIIIFIYILNLINTYKLHIERKNIEFEYLKEDTKNIAFVDTLTGAATRLKFDIVLEDLIHIASRFEEQKFTITMIDIDNFKKVNDTYGHDYGDAVLQEVASVIKKYMKESDTFARWGGEEFVVLSPLSNIKNSYKFANKIRKLISQIQFEKLEQVTCSFGLSIFEEGDTEKSIMKKADELLYLAKKNGKNRVE